MKLAAIFLTAILISSFSLTGFMNFASEDFTVAANAANSLNVKLEEVADGKASLTNETSHTSPFSAKLVIPTGAQQGSCAFALYPYNKPLSSILTVSIFASFKNAVPVFVFRLDRNGDGTADISLMSDYPFGSNGEWRDTTVGNRWGWTEASNYLSVYGKIWNQLDYWKNLYGNATVLYVGIALEYWAVEPTGFDEPMYADELTINGVTYNIAPAGEPAPTPTPLQPSFKISGYILDSDGRGIAGAHLILNSPLVPSVSSDSSGHYNTSAPAGTYRLNVWPPFDSNYINHDETGLVVGSDMAKNITLYTGFKVSGYITNASGTPMVGAAVLFKNPNRIYGSGWFTNSAGYYFLSLPAGTYTIDAHPQTKFDPNYKGLTTDFPTYYEHNFTVNGSVVKNITVGESATPDSRILKVELQTQFDGEASFTSEKIHTSPKPVRLSIPKNATAGSYAMALYPFYGTLSSISSFSIFASYVNATPRFILHLDKNGDGTAETFLLSDYQFKSNGEWKTTTGGSRWGWTETNIQMTNYGTVWNPLDYWTTKYGNLTVLYIGIVLEYWAVDPDGYGEPLYADELILNGITYNILPITPPEPATSVKSWPMFHRDPAHSGYTESTGPLTNQTLWKFQTGSGVESSPAVVGGIVYVGALWNGKNGFVYALNASTGSKIWEFATNSGVESSPAVVDGVVYIGSYLGQVYALNALNGSLIWSFNAGGSVFPSPAVVDGLVYVGSATGYMYALNATNGSPSWSYYTSGRIVSSPAVVGGVVYFGSEDQNFYALRASDGTQVWRYTTAGFIDTSPTVAGGIVYFGSRDGYIYALNATDGFRIWSFISPHRQGGAYYYSTPAVASGVVYVGSYDSSVYALNAANGRIFWEFRTGGYIFSSPVVAGGAVYVGSFDGNVYALNAGTGSKIWSYQTGDQMRSSAAVVNGVVYVGSGNGYVIAFGSPNNQQTSQETSATPAPASTESTASNTQQSSSTPTENAAQTQPTGSPDAPLPEVPIVEVNKKLVDDDPSWSLMFIILAVGIIVAVIGVGCTALWQMTKSHENKTLSTLSKYSGGGG